MKKLVTLGVCLALAGPALADGLTEDFNGTWVPDGWTVVDNDATPSDPARIWRLNTFYPDDNWTGGDGDCADVNSDYYSGMSCCVDTELISPVFVVPDGATLEFDTNYQTYLGNDYADTDITIDGGTTWINLLSWHGLDDEQGTFMDTGVHIVADISAYAGETAQVRFNHYGSWWEWYWQVDNVVVAGEAPPIPTVSEWGLIAMAVIVTGLGGFLFRKHKVEG